MNFLVIFAAVVLADYARRRAYFRRYYIANKSRMLAGMKRWTEANRLRSREIKARWEKLNPEKYRHCANAYRRARAIRDPKYKLQRTLRARFIKVLRSRGIYGRRCSFKAVDVGRVCSHIESRFAPGMSWANHGNAWHVDHIIPCAEFDLTDPRQVARCFHWTNLQPLWAKDNHSKGAKLMLQSELSLA